MKIPPELSYVFELHIEVDSTVHIGRGIDEELRFTPIVGGFVEGHRLRGRILPGGGDWSVRRSGTTQLEARYVLESEDGALIDILNRGYYRGEDTAQQELISPYYRTAPVFQTDARSEEHTSELQSRGHLVCRLLLEKKKTQ